MQHTYRAYKRTAAALIFSALALAPSIASAQQDYPNRPLKVIIPLPAGGAADVSMRTMALELEKQLKQPVVVDNKPG